LSTNTRLFSTIFETIVFFHPENKDEFESTHKKKGIPSFFKEGIPFDQVLLNTVLSIYFLRRLELDDRDEDRLEELRLTDDEDLLLEEDILLPEEAELEELRDGAAYLEEDELLELE